MRFTRIWKTMVFELKSLRLYWFPILTMTVIVPFSYLLVIVFSSGFSVQKLSIILPGFMVVSIFSILVLPLAQRISNMFSDDIIELLASLPVSMREIVLAYAGTYTMLSLPLMIGPAIILALSEKLNVMVLVVGLFMLWCLALNVSFLLGLIVRNKLKLDPLLSITLLAVIMLTPAFYSINNVTGLLKLIILANPLTHVVLVIRASIGVSEGVPLAISLIYLSLIIVVLTTALLLKIRVTTLNIIEKR